MHILSIKQIRDNFPLISIKRLNKHKYDFENTSILKWYLTILWSYFKFSTSQNDIGIRVGYFVGKHSVIQKWFYEEIEMVGI